MTPIKLRPPPVFGSLGTGWKDGVPLAGGTLTELPVGVLMDPAGGTLTEQPIGVLMDPALGAVTLSRSIMLHFKDEGETERLPA